MPALDLIDDDAAPAKEIIGAFKPAMSKDEDLASTSALFKKEGYSGTAGEVMPCYLWTSGMGLTY